MSSRRKEELLPNTSLPPGGLHPTRFSDIMRANASFLLRLFRRFDLKMQVEESQSFIRSQFSAVIWPLALFGTMG
eukprot:scaffold680860_cov67-Prasinocladus_malaysianus.AAC.1